MMVMSFVVVGCQKVVDKEVGMSKERMDDKDDNKRMNEGAVAPNFQLMDLEGRSHSLMDYKGEKVYVKYWASWCSICLAGLEDLNTLAGEANGFKVISIVTPNYKGEKDKEAFVQWFGGLDLENLTVLLDEAGVYAKEFGVRAFPTSAYIGSDGILVKVAPGHTDNQVIEEKMEALK